ncbi:MAG: NAD(P)H-dependent oxidoreductase subunit E, partial [Mogibacterium diversum]|nr:NAD(P)H-dependent oxidoreductase subunit E [Mogibacterium diversum]
MKSLNELRAIKNKMMCQVNLRLGGEAAIHAEAEGAQVHKNYILVCGGTGCTSNHSLDVVKAFETHLKEHGLQDDVKIIQTGCLGLCAKGPVVVVHPGSVYYEEVDPEKVEAIVNEHIVGGVPTDKYMLKEETTDGSPAKTMTESDFYTKQERIALRNCGVIDPENIDEYIATGGYEALGRCLTEMTPDEVIQTVLDSGIRGRGGAGFPTGKKWKFASGNRGEVQKYVCCNADEGDPGAFMDRSILEGDPHSVFEAMAIAGYAIGADQGYIYVRAEYPIAVNRLEIALKQAREYGLIGKDIFGTGFNFDIDLRLGAGAFVCGEETALLTSIEGNRGEPHPRPPFPAVKGLFGCPTILNNVETYANIPVIFNKGPEWFSSLGTELSPGTKVFALGGKINNT